MCYLANGKLCQKENCEECYNASFASEESSKYWSPKNNIRPRDITKGSHQKNYLFVCDK